MRALSVALVLSFVAAPSSFGAFHAALAPVSEANYDWGMGLRLGLETQNERKTYLFQFLNTELTLTANAQTWIQVSSALYVNALDQFYAGLRAGIATRGGDPKSLGALSVQKRFDDSRWYFEFDLGFLNGGTQMLVGYTF